MTTTPEPDTAPETAGMRINKYLALCGYESRRRADKLISDGLVEINGKRIDELGVRVQPGDFVKVNGKRALPKEGVTILLNKPRGYVCSRDAQGAQGTVFDLLPAAYRHVNYVGRLDMDSEGLLLLTNKADLGNRIAHPSYGVEKEYLVTLDKPYEDSVLLQLLRGLRLPEGQVRAKQAARLSPRRACVVLEQGVKRQVRRMFACLGLNVRKLVRVRIGSLRCDDLQPGHSVPLSPEQEKLAFTNPRKRKGLIDAEQAFALLTADKAHHRTRTKNGGRVDNTRPPLSDERTTRAAADEDAHYRFNPDDFETEEEAENTGGTPHREFSPRRGENDRRRRNGGNGPRRRNFDMGRPSSRRTPSRNNRDRGAYGRQGTPQQAARRRNGGNRGGGSGSTAYGRPVRRAGSRPRPADRSQYGGPGRRKSGYGERTRSGHGYGNRERGTFEKAGRRPHRDNF